MQVKFDTTNNKCKKYKIHILQQHRNSVKCQNFTALHNLIKIYLNCEAQARVRQGSAMIGKGWQGMALEAKGLKA